MTFNLYPACPHCGYEYDSTFPIEESDSAIQCDNCLKYFTVQISFTTSIAKSQE